MLIIFIICLLIFVVVTFLVVKGSIEALDQQLSAAIINLRRPAVTPIMHFFTNLGKGKATLAVVLLLFVIPGLGNIPRISGLALILTMILGGQLKNIVKRGRPEGNRLVEEKDFSFPSAHSYGAAALYGGILLNAGNLAAPFALILTIISATCLLLVGLSRVYLGIHYPLDVLGGWSLGLTCAAGMTLLFL